MEFQVYDIRLLFIPLMSLLLPLDMNHFICYLIYFWNFFLSFLFPNSLGCLHQSHNFDLSTQTTFIFISHCFLPPNIPVSQTQYFNIEIIGFLLKPTSLNVTTTLLNCVELCCFTHWWLFDAFLYCHIQQLLLYW